MAMVEVRCQNLIDKMWPLVGTLALSKKMGRDVVCLMMEGVHVRFLVRNTERR